MSVQSNGGTTGQRGGVTGRGFMPGQSGNPGGKPQGLAKLAREAVGDGADLVQLMVSVLRGDKKVLGVRQVTLRERMQAAEWLAERGWGKAPVVADADLPEEPQASSNDPFAWVERLPPDLRKALGEHIDREFEAGIEADIAEVDKAIKATMPAGGSPSRSVRPQGGATKVPE